MTTSTTRPGTPQSAPRSAARAPVHDLVVLSHLRWTWVWQRPQHLVSRFAAARAVAGAATYFVEEPVAARVNRPEIQSVDCGGGVTRIWLAIPEPEADGPTPGFNAPGAQDYGRLLGDFFREHDRELRFPDVLLYTPMAYDIAVALQPGCLAYDVMDDLASFAEAPQGLKLRQRRLLDEADVVFTGGRSLHRLVAAHRGLDCHLFPSGVDTAHYASAIALRRPHHWPVAGYVGVLDERLDLGLVAGLAAALPSWTLRMVGPVAKIDPDRLPQAPNIEYPGQVDYAALPTVMAGLDVALMPFALNKATQSISPTKTLEYLAAGVPVVSTRVPDVVTDYGNIVRLADDAAGFATACWDALSWSTAERDRWLRVAGKRQEWDVIAAEMADLLQGARAASAETLTSAAMA